MFIKTRHKWLPADGCKGKGGEREEQRVKECSHRVRKVEKKSVTSTRLIQKFKWQHPLKCTLQLPLIWPWLDISTRETFRYSVYFRVQQVNSASRVSSVDVLWEKLLQKHENLPRNNQACVLAGCSWRSYQIPELPRCSLVLEHSGTLTMETPLALIKTVIYH